MSTAARMMWQEVHGAGGAGGSYAAGFAGRFITANWHNLLAVVYPVFIGWVIWKTAVYTRFPFASGLQMRICTQ